jgi:molybdenum cofactor biosynthesis protein B
MVDFQSRDTSRGRSTEDESDTADEATDQEDATESGGNDAATAVSSESETSADPDPGNAGTDGPDPAVPTGESEADHDHALDHAHAHGHEDVGQLGVAVVTVTSTRGRDEDPSGDAIIETVEAADHEVVTRDVVADDLDGIQRTVLALTGRDDVDVVVTTGGTGVTPDDVTVEAVTPLFDKDLPGFGELFRILSYEEVGTRALGSRAAAGVSEGVPVFCLPGSENAVRLGMEELVAAEMAHLVELATGAD